MVIHFERHGVGPRFVDLKHDETRVVLRAGRLGTEGVEHARQYENQEIAIAASARQRSRLESKGYWPGHHEPTLLNAIRENPSDAGRFQVYADWLLERQDPRGLLINAMNSGDRSVAEELLVNHAAELLPTWWLKHEVVSHWSLGFLSELHIAACDDPWVVRRMLRHPSAFVIRKLTLTRAARSFTSATWVTALATALLR